VRGQSAVVSPCEKTVSSSLERKEGGDASEPGKSNRGCAQASGGGEKSNMERRAPMVADRWERKEERRPRVELGERRWLEEQSGEIIGGLMFGSGRRKTGA